MVSARIGREFGLVTAAIILTGCGGLQGGSGSGGGGDQATGPAHHVMVIDDGFDPTDAVFSGKIAAQYTLQCAASSLSESDPNRSFAEDKARYLKALAIPDTSCSLLDGISPKISPTLANFEGYRDGWNRFVKSKGTDRSGITPELQDDVKAIQAAVSGEDISYHYHGNGTAGLIAYQNPGVKLILVERSLGEAPSSTEAADPVTCPNAADFQRVIDLARDPDIQAAYAKRPLSSEEAGLADIAAKYQVSLINESFGSTSRQTLEKALAAANCPSLDLVSFYRSQGVLNAKRAAFLEAQRPEWARTLRVQAAGNDGVQIDSPDDSFECASRGQHTVLIGALTEQRAIATFSDYGKCVDSYTLGQNVIIAAPDDFLNIESGTSFSSPLTVRFLSLNSPESATADDMIALLKSKTDPAGYLSADAVPPAVSYDEKDTVLDQYRLSGSATPRASFAITPRPARNLLRQGPLPFQPLLYHW